jgi:membrane protein DedA with SNARE-associated domain
MRIPIDVTTDALPLIGLFGLILVKESGVPIPVPGDLVVIGAGVAAARGDLDPIVAVVGLIVASLAGGIVQFGLLRSVARPAALRLLLHVASADRIDRESGRLRERGAGSVAVARMTPGVRILAIAASAIGGVPAGAFVAGLAAGNAAFIAAHFGLGYLAGEPIFGAIGGALGMIAIGGIALAAAGALAWIALSRRRRGRPATEAFGAWADASCPVCLGLALARAEG